MHEEHGSQISVLLFMLVSYVSSNALLLRKSSQNVIVSVSLIIPVA